MQYNIERANSGDAERVVPLVMEAYGDTTKFLCASDDLLLVRQRLTDAFSLNVLTSYHNFFVIRRGGDPAAVVSCVAGSKIAVMNNNFAAYISSVDRSSRAMNTAMQLKTIQEASEDSYYLDVLAVDQRYRGEGLAAALIEHVVQRARAEKFKSILLYAEDRLKPFYERHLFAFYQKVLFGGKEYNQMCRNC